MSISPNAFYGYSLFSVQRLSIIKFLNNHNNVRHEKKLTDLWAFTYTTFVGIILKFFLKTGDSGTIFHQHDLSRLI